MCHTGEPTATAFEPCLHTGTHSTTQTVERISLDQATGGQNGYGREWPAFKLSRDWRSPSNGGIGGRR